MEFGWGTDWRMVGRIVAMVAVQHNTRYKHIVSMEGI